MTPPSITPMLTTDLARVLSRLFAELVHGAATPGGNFILNSGDIGLLGSLDRLPAAEASQAVDGGATVAAHAQHLRYGLSLMNRWVTEGGNPFADATWDVAWRTTSVSVDQWEEIRTGLRAEVTHWLTALGTERSVGKTELCGMIGSIAHLAYHLGAIRQIASHARGPRDGTFSP